MDSPATSSSCKYMMSMEPPPKRRPPSYVVNMLTFCHGCELKSLFDFCREHVDDPVAVLKEVADYTRAAPRQLRLYSQPEPDKPPFEFRHQKNVDQFVANPTNCDRYSSIVAKLYGGIFSCDNKKLSSPPPEEDDHPLDATENAAAAAVIFDVDLLCVFVAMVALRLMENVSALKRQLFDLILDSLRAMKSLYACQWKTWPFTRLAGGNEMRDRRTFDALCGFDFRHGRKNKWASVSSSYVVHVRREQIKSLKANISALYHVDDNNDEDDDQDVDENVVYVGEPVYDMFKFLPPETHELLFGRRLAQVLRLCYDYSVSNMPYVLASDTHPVRADDFPAIAPSGCRRRGSAPCSTNNLTLVSRHAIPSARKLGVYLLDRKESSSSTRSLERAVAECMVNNSQARDEDAHVSCPESETKCLERHISRLYKRNNKNTEERCCLCDDKLNVEPVFQSGTKEALFDYFPLHAFMDTYEAVDKNCSASLCPECLIRNVHFIYNKVSTGGVAINDAFRCPSCDEYMINWLGRASEVSNICGRLLVAKSRDGVGVNNPKTHFRRSLRRQLLKRIETCFSALEMLQEDFVLTALSDSEFFMSEESKFFVFRKDLRPPVRRYRLTRGNVANRYSLNCVQCVSPLCCDRPSDQDVETVDVVPPYRRYTDSHGFDVEDVAFNRVPEDGMFKYDDGPGTHRWPAQLSCGFVSANTPRPGEEEEIETCAQAIALLGRIPQKKMRGWNIESPEGKAVVALAKWHKNKRPPQDMHYLLREISAVFKPNDCLCLKAPHHPFLPQFRAIHQGVVSETAAFREPLIDAYFKAYFCDQEENPLMEYADLFVRNLVSEFLLQMPECVYHRAWSFVLHFADSRHLFGMRPDEAAKSDYIQSLNISRHNLATSENSQDSPPSYKAASRERTVEWAVEKGGKQVKTVRCFQCKTPAIKYGGCVTLICEACGAEYCWLCERPTQNVPDHTIRNHRLLYSTCNSSKRTYEILYGMDIATLQLHVFEGKKEYVLEDGFVFDVKANRAVKQNV